MSHRHDDRSELENELALYLEERPFARAHQQVPNPPAPARTTLPSIEVDAGFQRASKIQDFGGGENPIVGIFLRHIYETNGKISELSISVEAAALLTKRVGAIEDRQAADEKAELGATKQRLEMLERITQAKIDTERAKAEEAAAKTAESEANAKATLASERRQFLRMLALAFISALLGLVTGGLLRK